MIEPIQVLEAVEAGARAILLIVRALNDDELKTLRNCADTAGIDCLYEIHTQGTRKSTASQPGILGVNNRDLPALSPISPSPKNCSHISPRELSRSVRAESLHPKMHGRVEDAEADAILCGEALMRTEDPGSIHRRNESDGIVNRFYCLLFTHATEPI